jgi:ATP-dependent helicase/nuclease subunit A
MVDEYQDSNEVQDAIYAALTEEKQNLFMVGDVKQSIYQFRLADPGIFLEKYAAYVDADEAKPGEGRKVMLSRNFRSGGAVLAAVNDVFETCMSPQVGGLYYGRDEALYEGVKHERLGYPEAQLHCVDVQEDTYGEEAAYVARQIKDMLQAGTLVRQGNGFRPVQPGDIVILLRSPGSVGRHYQAALESLGIRCTSGGGEDLLQTQEVATLHSLMQVIQNPLQDIPLVAVMISPVFGFTADDMAAIRSQNKITTIYEAVRRFDSEKCRKFIEVLDRLRKTSRTQSLSVLLEEIFFLTHLDTIFGVMEGGDIRRENLHAFYHMAAAFEAGGQGDLGRFLEHLQSMAQKGLIASDDRGSAGAVTVMSIHKSKGLEFPVVFLCGLSREFNTESQRAQILCHKQMGIGMSAVDHSRRVRYPTVAKGAIASAIGADGLSEELRVLYVAMTRAKDRLYLSDSAGMDFDGGFRLPSRFVFNAGAENVCFVRKLDAALMQSVKDLVEQTERFDAGPAQKIEGFAEGTRVRHPMLGDGTVLLIQKDTGAYLIQFDKFPTPRSIRREMSMERL